MRALSVRQPWAELIARGEKTLEVRSWSTSHRGPLLIVAGVARHALWRLHADVDGVRGCAVCVVDLVDVRAGRVTDIGSTGGVDPTGQFVWVLHAARRCEPTAIKGSLGLFHAAAPVMSASDSRLSAAAPTY